MAENLLQEDTEISLDDLKVKVRKLDSYLKRAEHRITMLEKKLARTEAESLLAAKKVVA